MIYLDTSFVAPMLLREPSSAKVERVLTGLPAGEAAVSHWTRTEFASAVARRVRMGDLATQDALRAIRSLDEIIERSIELIAPVSEDFVSAQRIIVESDWQLRAGDALHLAIARARGASAFLTLDAVLLGVDGRFGVPISAGTH